MSVGTTETEAKAGENGAGDVVLDQAPAKPARFDRCFTGLDIKLVGPLKDMDPDKLKREIQRWAKAVVAYARQLSFKSPKTPPSRHGSMRGGAELAKEEEEEEEKEK